MSDKGIIFSAPMVRALLDGRKTQTRRLIKPKAWNAEGDKVNIAIAPTARFTQGSDGRHYFAFDHPRGGPLTAYVSPYAPGDRLYVREAWRPHYLGDGVWDLDVTYAADGLRRTIKDGEFGEDDWTWPKAADRGNVPSIHMPRWASRMFLNVTEVRVQRLQDISEADARAEGLGDQELDGMEARGWFRDLWDFLHTAEGERWEDNPWIVAVSFDVHHGNIDAERAA
ncbi:hypothetical protein [Novosphingobium sp. KN65.2]|uniref:hypothetical protein n=1 Tax=Novosphingobium sp. KN65.2 TaxID=1478134 RepID=UPI0005E669EB|nr:hypothetical protein [Novosphingobium sp. KN65.2]CDO34548.1 conserved hypothetical protein [Novosphingobium sp. KN65.2]